MNRALIHQWFSQKNIRGMWGGAIACLIVSSLLLVSHIMVVRQVRDIGLPLATLVPDLKKRLQVLEEQVELARVHAATSRGSPEEFVHVFVLPEDASMDRLIASFEAIRDVLHQGGDMFSMTPINIGEKSIENDLSLWPVSFTVSVSEKGLDTLSLFLRIAGFFTVADVLTPEDVKQLFLYAESENPVGIIALEQFLSADLLSYTTEYQSFMEMVRKSFVSPAFDRMFTELQESSLLREVRMLLSGPFGDRLRKENLWPLRFMTVDTVTVNTEGGGKLVATFEISAYSRH